MSRRPPFIVPRWSSPAARSTWLTSSATQLPTRMPVAASRWKRAWSRRAAGLVLGGDRLEQPLALGLRQRPWRRGRAERAADQPRRVLRDRAGLVQVAEEHAQATSASRSASTAFFGPPWAAVRATGAARNRATSSWPMVADRATWAAVGQPRGERASRGAGTGRSCAGDRPSASSWTRNRARASWRFMLGGAPWKGKRRPRLSPSRRVVVVIRPGSSPRTAPS